MHGRLPMTRKSSSAGKKDRPWRGAREVREAERKAIKEAEADARAEQEAKDKIEREARERREAIEKVIRDASEAAERKSAPRCPLRRPQSRVGKK